MRSLGLDDITQGEIMEKEDVKRAQVRGKGGIGILAY